jgi:hypothetical protein
MRGGKRSSRSSPSRWRDEILQTNVPSNPSRHRLPDSPADSKEMGEGVDPGGRTFLTVYCPEGSMKIGDGTYDPRKQSCRQPVCRLRRC